MRVPYPRTAHLPWSPGASADDVRLSRPDGLRGREVVVTEKLDGENTTLYADGLHARSVDSAHHPSRTWVKALQGRLAASIPAGWRICGENMFARHSLAYEDLESWFYGFSVWDRDDQCLDWDRTVAFLRRLGLPVPRVLWRGRYDERALRGLRLDTSRQEGYVVRPVEGFPRAEFPWRVAKWVRPHHVRTDRHWMHGPVVENGLGPGAPLWAVRSGAPVDGEALAAAAGFAGAGKGAEGAVADVTARLDGLGRIGDARLAGVLAVLLRQVPRVRSASGLAVSVDMPTARRVADLVGLYPGLQRPYPDAERRAGLVRMAFAADLGVLHAVAAADLAGRTGEAAGEAREQVEWSALHAEDSGLAGEAPLRWLRSGLREALAGLGAEAADRCWAEARTAYAQGRISSVEEAVAATWRWRSGRFPRLVQTVGPSGSGKSTFARGLTDVAASVSLDDLRTERGARADQRHNDAVLREGLARLDAALAGGGTAVWDATGLTPHQRLVVRRVAERHDALLTYAVLLVTEDELARRNGSRSHPVPQQVLTRQQHRFVPPYPGHAHRTWYVGAGGDVEDVDGVLRDGRAC